MVRHLTPDDFRSMPWKNGAGRTTEIAVHPAGSSLDDFAWRVSIADVAGDGPFSAFPGINRTIVLLEGAGMLLNGDEAATELTTPFVPHAFRGEETVDCTLVAGPCRDFNAMFRRERGRGSVSVVHGADAPFDLSQFRLVYAAKGSHECTITGLPAHRLDEGHALVDAESALGRENAAILVRPLADDAVALVVCMAER